MQSLSNRRSSTGDVLFYINRKKSTALIKNTAQIKRKRVAQKENIKISISQAQTQSSPRSKESLASPSVKTKNSGDKGNELSYPILQSQCMLDPGNCRLELFRAIRFDSIASISELGYEI